MLTNLCKPPTRIPVVKTHYYTLYSCQSTLFELLHVLWWSKHSPELCNALLRPKRTLRTSASRLYALRLTKRTFTRFAMVNTEPTNNCKSLARFPDVKRHFTKVCKTSTRSAFDKQPSPKLQACYNAFSEALKGSYTVCDGKDEIYDILGRFAVVKMRYAKLCKPPTCFPEVKTHATNLSQPAPRYAVVKTHSPKLSQPVTCFPVVKTHSPKLSQPVTCFPVVKTHSPKLCKSATCFVVIKTMPTNLCKLSTRPLVV